MRLCIERILPPCRERAVKFTLPPIESAEGDAYQEIRAGRVTGRAAFDRVTANAGMTKRLPKAPARRSTGSTPREALNQRPLPSDQTGVSPFSIKR
jgi:hypothetical protein